LDLLTIITHDVKLYRILVMRKKISSVFWNKSVKCVIVPAQILTLILTRFITKFDLKTAQISSM